MTIQKHTVLQKLYLGIKITTQGMQLRYFDYNLSRTSKQAEIYFMNCILIKLLAGAPNENIVQNHLNIALLNVFKYLNGRYYYRHIFIP